MQPRDRTVKNYGTAYFVDGTRYGPVYKAGSNQDVDVLNAIAGQLHGDRRTPNPYSWSKVTSVGLRADAMDAAQGLAPSVIFRQTGPRSSYLDQKGLLLWKDSFASIATSAALEKLTTLVRGDLDVSIDLFQWKQALATSDRLLHLTRTFSDSWKSMKRGKGPIKEAADLYLEWTYGITPTVNTLVGLYKKIHDAGLAGQGLVHYRARGKALDHDLLRQNIASILYGPLLPVTFSVESSFRVQYDIYLKPDLTQWQKLSGYTSLMPVIWLYEMTPYSFVLDWFWNLGGYMRQLETALIHQSRFASGTQTNTLKQVTTIDTSATSRGTIEMKNFSGSHDFRGMDRYVLTSYPVPKLPTWNPQMGSRRILNAAALLSQLLPDMFGKDRNRVVGRSGGKTPRFVGR